MPIGPEDKAVNITPTEVGDGIESTNTYVIEYQDPDDATNFLFAKTVSEGSSAANFGPFQRNDSTFPLNPGTTLTAFVASNSDFVRVRITSGTCSTQNGGTTAGGNILGQA